MCYCSHGHAFTYKGQFPERTLYLFTAHTHLCVSKCCPVSVDLLVMVSYWLFAKRITGGSCSDLKRSGVSYLTTSPNSEVNKTLLTENTMAWTMTVLTQSTMVNL